MQFIPFGQSFLTNSGFRRQLRVSQGHTGKVYSRIPRVNPSPLPSPHNTAMSSPSPKNSILDSLRADGYVIIPNLIPQQLLEPLREAAARAVARARDEMTENGWPHVRVVGKQFPPWPKGAREDVWGVQHIMHPALREPVFSSWYGLPALIQTVTNILECHEDQLQLGGLPCPVTIYFARIPYIR